ncbi:outer membrane beta-barrel protein [Epilithonimonas hispanica]|uniref:Uncharacterized protein n=1 Tax=Epilithonimonas hispanica TaxID=358687 RepID=A0A3D9D2S0_9FLAO|nr:outer membrane beta-barrel protein [Epilithonimonas hispanica]REC72306.1 hypothetical protein DRF58_03355 [Epilithonimonas hispanica]
MKRFLLSTALFCFAFFSSQGVQPSLGINAVTFLPMGDNFLKDGLKNFVGVGLTYQTVFKRNMGFGIELNRAFSEVKDRSVYGDLEKPRLTNISAYFIYKYPFTEAFSLQGQIGGSFMAITSQSRYTKDDFTEQAGAFFLGTELSYKFPKLKKLEIFASPKLYFYDSFVEFRDKGLDKYYSKAQLLNINVGIRLNLNEK